MGSVPSRNSKRIAPRMISATGRFYLQALILILVCCLPHSEISAAPTKYWDGGAGTSNWGDGDNWKPNGVPSIWNPVDLTGANTININVAATTYDLNLNNSGLVLTILSGNSLTVTGNLTLTSGTLNTEGSFPTVSGSVSLTGGTVGYTASGGSQTVAVQSYGNLTISGGGTKTLAGSITPSGVLTISGGIFDLGSYTANRTSAGGTLTVSNGATLSIGGTNTLPSNYSTHSIGATSTINYAGANQTVATLNSSQNYGHLTISGSGTKTLGGDMTVRGTLTITGATLADGGYTLSANGNISNSTSHTGTGKILLSGGSSAHSLAGGGSYTNLELNDANGATLAGTVGIAGDLTVSGGTFDLGSYTADRTSAGGTLTVSSGATLSIGGTNTLPSNYSTHSIGATSTINYAGANQTVATLNSSQNYGHLTISGSGTKTLAGDMTVRGTLTITGATLADGGYTLSANGNISNSTSHTGTGKILLSGGSSAHSLAGGGSYTNLELNDANGATLASNMTVNGSLTLTSGKITTNANTLSISSTGSVSRTSGHVVGNLQKYMATGATSKTFEVGDASSYTPVDVSFASVSTGGNLTAATTVGDHPSIGTSTISPSKSVNRYWTLANSSIVFTDYSATFNFVSGDVDGGANTSLFIVGKYEASVWSSPAVGTRTSTSTQATGLTGFGDFQVGESAILSVTVSDSIFAFGFSPINTWLTPQTSVMRNDGNVAEDFVGEISQFTEGGYLWDISSTINGADTIRAQWSTTSETGPWTDISAYDAIFNIATNVAVNDSVVFWFRIQTPTTTSSYNEHSSTLTVTAQKY